MTREETIECLEYQNDMSFGGQSEALKMAINALEQEPKADTWSIKEVVDTLVKHGLIVEQEPRPKGKWEFDKKGYFSCSECKRKPKDQTATTDFCPHCGADMREGEE